MSVFKTILFRMQVSRVLREAGKDAAKKGGIPTVAQKNSSLKDQFAPIVRYWNGIKQAKSNDGGIIPRIRGPFTRLMRDSYIRYGDFVGEDARGLTRFHLRPLPLNDFKEINITSTTNIQLVATVMLFMLKRILNNVTTMTHPISPPNGTDGFTT